MANTKNVQVTLGFRADTSGAEQALRRLNQQLNAIQNLSAEGLHVDLRVKEAADAAKLLQTNLQAAFNVNTNQINVGQLTANLNRAGTSVTELGQKLIDSGRQGTAAYAQLARTIATMDAPLKTHNKLLTDAMTTLKNTIKWQISSQLVHGIQGTFQQAIGYVKNLNTALTDIRIVSGASVEEMTKFAQQANIAAKALGTTTRAYADAALTFYQQGDSAEMAAKKAEIALKATNIAFNATASQMSEMLTATWNSYQAGTDDLQHYVDVMARIGSTTATSMEEIATGMQKVAGAANNVGVSMEKMSALIATVSSTTRQSAETIGTSMNTILSRITSLKLGETLEDDVTLTKYTDALRTIGIQAVNTYGELESGDKIIEALGEKWQTLSKAQQTAIATTVGGARQYNTLMTLFSNWDKYKNILDDVQNNSAGTLEKMNKTYLESWEGASQTLQASIENIWSTLIKDQSMIKFIKTLTTITDQFQNLIQSMGGLPGLLTQIGAIGLQVFSRDIAAGLTRSIEGAQRFANSFKELGFNKENLQMTENQRWHQATLSAISEQLVGVDTKQGLNDYGLSAQIQASEILIDKKIQLQQIENSLSDEQKKAAQIQLSNLAAEANQIDQLSQRYQEINTQLNQQKRGMTSIADLQEASTRSTVYNNVNPQNYSQVANNVAQQWLTISNQQQSLHGQNYNFSAGGLFQSFDISKMTTANAAIDALIERYENLHRIQVDVERVGSVVSSALSLQEVKKENIEEISAALEQTKNRFSAMGADTTKLDEFLNKLKTASGTELTNLLREISTEMNNVGNAANMSATTAFNILANSLGLSTDRLRAVADAANLSEEQIIRLAQATRAYNNDADQMNIGLSRLQQSIQTTVQVVGQMAGAFTSTFNLLSNWDSSNIASKIMGISSTVMQAGKALTAFAASNWIQGLLISGTTILGAILGRQQQIIKQHTKAFEEATEKSKEAYEKSTKELNNTKDLINNYNELYIQYKQGKDVQNELAIAAEKLADAYNITGASVAAVTGNFEQFNNEIERTLNLDKELKATNRSLRISERAIRSGTQVLQDNTFNRSFDSTLNNESFLWDNTDINLSNVELYQGITKNGSNNLNDSQKVFMSQAILAAGQQALQDYIAQNTTYEIQPGFFGTKQVAIQPTIQNQIEFLQNRYGINDEILLSHLVQQGPGSQEYIKEILPQLFLEKNENFIEDLGLSSTSLYFDKDAVINSLDLNEQISDWGEQFGRIIQNGVLIPITQDMTEYEQAIMIQEYGKFNEHLQDLRSQYNEDSGMYSYYTDIMNRISNIVAENIQTAANQYLENYEQYAQLQTAQKVVKNLSGISTDNPLITVQNMWIELAEQINTNKEQWPSLQDLDENSDEYIQARNKIITQLISDYSALDEAAKFYNDIVNQFGENNVTEIIKFANNNDISDISQLSAFIPIITALLSQGKSIEGNELIQAILKTEQASERTNEAQTNFTKVEKGQTALKNSKQMTADDWATIRETYKDIVGFDWDKFIKMNYDERSKYLEQIKQHYLKELKETQTIQLESAKEEKAIWESSLQNRLSEIGVNGENLETQLRNAQLMAEQTRLLILQAKKDLGPDATDEQINNQVNTIASENGAAAFTTNQLEQYDNLIQEGTNANNKIVTAEDSLAVTEAILGTKINETAAKALTMLNIKLTNLKDNLTTLSSIDYTKNIIQGIQAFELLDKTLQKTGKSIKDYQSANSIDRIKMLTQAQKTNIQDQILQSQASMGWYQIQARTEQNYQGKNFAELSDHEVRQLAISNSEVSTIYEQWQKLNQAVKNYQDQIIELNENEKQSIIKIRAQELDTKIAALENNLNQDKKIAENWEKASEAAQNAINSGILSQENESIILNTIGEDWYKSWNEAANAQERAAVAISLMQESYAKTLKLSKDTANNLNATSDIIAEQIEISERRSSRGNSSIRNYRNGLYGTLEGFKNVISELNVSDEIASVLVSNYDAVMKELTPDNSIMDFWTKFETIISTACDNAKLDLEKVKNAFQDNIANIFIEFGEKVQSQATEAAEKWIKAFDTIAAAKKKLIAGESLIDMLGDPEQLAILIESTGKSATQLLLDAARGTLTLDDLNTTIDYNKQKEFALQKLTGTTIQITGNKEQDSINLLQEILGGQYEQEGNTYYALDNEGKRKTAIDENGNEVEQVYTAADLETRLIEIYTQALQTAYSYTENDAKNISLQYVKNGVESPEISNALNRQEQIVDISTQAKQITEASNSFNSQIQELSNLQSIIQKSISGQILSGVDSEKLRQARVNYNSFDDSDLYLSLAQKQQDLSIQSQQVSQMLAKNTNWSYNDQNQTFSYFDDETKERIVLSFADAVQVFTKEMGQSFSTTTDQYVEQAEKDLEALSDAAIKKLDTIFTSVDSIQDAVRDYNAIDKADYKNKDGIFNQENYEAARTKQLESLNSELVKLGESLDLTKPEIEAAYQKVIELIEGFKNGTVSVKELNTGLSDLDTAVIANSDVSFKQNALLTAMAQKWKDNEIVTDEYGNVLNATTMEAMRNTHSMSIMQSALDKSNKKLSTNATSFFDLAKEIKNSGLSIEDFISQTDGLEEAEQNFLRLIYAISNGVPEIDQIFSDFNTEGMEKIKETLGEKFGETLLEAESNEGQAAVILYNIYSLFDTFGIDMENLLGTDEAFGVKAIDGANDNFQAAIEDFRTRTGITVEQCSDDVVRFIYQMNNAIAQAGGDLSTITWDDLAMAMGLNLDDFNTMLAELISFVQSAINTGTIDATGLIEALQGVWSQAKTLQAKYPKGSSGGRARVGTSAGETSTKPRVSDSTAPTSRRTRDNTRRERRARQNSAQDYQENEAERYHQIRDQLEKQDHLLTKIDKQKSRTYGQKHIDALNKEISALKEQNKLHAEYLNQAQTNLAANRTALTAQFGSGIFNEDGTIKYADYMAKITEELNAAIDRYNNSSQGEGDKMLLEKAKERYTELKKLLENYEEDLDLVDTIQQSIEDTQDKISSAALEIIQYKIEVNLDLNEDDLKRFEYFQSKWNDILTKQDEVMESLIASTYKYEDNLNTLGIEFNELIAQYQNGTLTQQDFQTGMSELNDKIYEQLNSLIDLKTKIIDVYDNTLSKAEEELSSFTARIEHATSVMQTFITMQQLMGLGANYGELTKFYQAQLNYNIANVEASKAYLETLNEQKNTLENQMSTYGGYNSAPEIMREQYDKLITHISSAEDDLLSQTQTALNTASEMFINTVQDAIDEYDKLILGTKNTFDDLVDSYNYYSESQERYLSTARELYDVSRLHRQIQDSLADATTKASKERLKALDEQIKKQSEAGRLTEYDVKMMELQYKYALALQALEDSKNAKSIVRLTRDENGNFGYQYTADQNEIDNAQQQVDDALQDINELAASRTQELEQQVVSTIQDYKQRILEVSQDTTLTIEERQAKIEELYRQFSETMTYLQEQYGHSTEALLLNQTYVQERYGISILRNTGLIQDQMSTAIQTMMSGMDEYVAHLGEQLRPGGSIYEAFAQYGLDLDRVGDASQLSWDSMTGSVEDYDTAVTLAAEQTERIRDQLEETVLGIEAATQEWIEHSSALETIIGQYENLSQTAAQAIRDVAQAQSMLYTTSEIGDNNPTAGNSTYSYSWAYGGLMGHMDGYSTAAAARSAARDDIAAKFKNTITAKQNDEDNPGEYERQFAEANRLIAAAVYSIVVNSSASAFKHGGLVDYTGPAWVDGSLNEPELMLNADDTKNILAAVDFVRQIDFSSIYDVIRQNTMNMLQGFDNLASVGSVRNTKTELQQSVSIQAEFPNVVDHNEIELAFNDLINQASQYANR